MVPGGLIDPFLPVLGDGSIITPIVAAHEGGAAYMADGYARASGTFGVCFCIGGPGATNAVTALGAALTDESPVLLVTGQVPTDWEGRGGFQDSSAAAFNDVEILRSITSQEFVVEDPRLLKFDLNRLLTKMLCYPRKPGRLVLPANIQETEVNFEYEKLNQGLYFPRPLDIEACVCFWHLAKRAGRIAILAGAGIEKSRASEELIKFAEAFEIPVATTLRAKGVFPEDHRLSLGVFGYGGTRHAIETIISGDVEVLIVLGSGLNQRDTLFWSKKFKPSLALVHVDIDPAVIGRTYKTELNIVGDCGEFLKYMRQQTENAGAFIATKGLRTAWLEKIRGRGARLYDAENCASDAVPVHPARVVCDLRRAMPRETVLLVDSGAHRAFAGHYWETYGPLRYLSATNLGPMGWAIPAAIGAKLARPALPCAVITGDGCMLMHGVEVQTAARYGVQVIYVVVNNSSFGNVYLRAKKMGAGPAKLTELPTHDWAGFARSLGAAGITVRKPGELIPAYEKALATGGPTVIDVICGKDYATPVTPYTEAAKEWTDND